MSAAKPAALRDAVLISLNTAAVNLSHGAVAFGDGVFRPPQENAKLGETMNSANIKRSIVRNGQKTSVSLEDEFWEGLREIANRAKGQAVDAGAPDRPRTAGQQPVLGDPRLRVQSAARAGRPPAAMPSRNRPPNTPRCAEAPAPGPAARGPWHCGWPPLASLPIDDGSAVWPIRSLPRRLRASPRRCGPLTSPPPSPPWRR